VSLFRSVLGDPGPVLRRGGVMLRMPAMQDFAAWTTLRGESRAFLQPWEPEWPHDDLIKSAFRRRIRRYQRELREEIAYSFLLFRAADDQLLGGLTLTNVRRGAAQCCTLGYWMGEPYAGKGYMSSAVAAIIDYVFRELKLHRIEAASMPHNQRSIALLEKAGFMREGYARSYLMINGVWSDHLLFGRLAQKDG
jgi:[ribosomal protein S5]-alanine N-acetyltransferase